MKDTMTFSQHLQSKIDQINRRQERNRKAMMDAIRRVEERNAIKPTQFFEPAEMGQMKPIRLSDLVAK
jgi:tRNA C32,U32 (ribose-2'-O)-methylase TrmJ